MLRRSLPDELINALAGNLAWQNLHADPSLFPEVRDGHVTVYHLGGALLRRLRLEGDCLTADLHRKFIPVRSSKDYVRLNWSTQGFGCADDAEVLPLGSASQDALEAYKEKMRLVLRDFPEGIIVQSILERTENCVVDQEITFHASGQSRDKVDLCHFDAGLQKLVFVEVKRCVDARLWKPEGQPEVLSQLNAYGDQLRTHRSGIIAAYREVVTLKRRLGLGTRLSSIPPNGPVDLLEKPVLVIGGCSRDDVRAIKSRDSEWLPLLSGLPDVAAGLILAGNDGCQLALTPGCQTIVF